MQWIVYVDHINSKHRITKYNVFDHAGFFKDCQENYKKNHDNKDAFLDRLRRDLFYWYGSKCEWEVIVAPLFSRGEVDEVKIDVNQQVLLNWEQFWSYVWDNKEELNVVDKRRKRTIKAKSNT